MSMPPAVATDRLYHPSPHPEPVADLMDEGSVSTAQLWGDKDGPSFADLIDIINPLQHIPLVSTIYRAITGDKIGLGARLAGGALFGGPLGVISAGVMSAVQEATGKDTSEHLAELFGGGEPSGKALAAVEPAAAAAPEPATAQAPAPGAAAAAGPAIATAAAAGPASRPATPPSLPPTPLRAVQAARDATPTPQPGGTATRTNPLAALDRAKGAQAAMLAAALQATAAPAQRSPEDGRDKTAAQAAHANLPPTGVALPEWAAQAMERALDSYQRAGTLRRDTRPMVTITE